MITAVIGTHVLCGLGAVTGGVTAMLTRKGSRRHRWAGRVWLIGLAGLCATAPILAALDWTHRWHLVLLGSLAALFAAFGYVSARRWPWSGRRTMHIAGMGGSFITALTAFYVDNGPRLPLWNLLPPITFWFLPAAVGAPVLIRAIRRHVRHRPRTAVASAGNPSRTAPADSPKRA